jgi:SAM-dependent methyltransferase
MHEPVRTFLQSVSEAFRLEGPLYEFGYGPGAASWAGCLPQSSAAGQGGLGPAEGEPAEIDRLEDLARLPFSDAAARTVIAVNVLEHVFEPRRAAEEIVRILAPGGILVLCSQTGVRAAGPPEHYWRPTPRAVQRLLTDLEATLIGWQGADALPHTLFGIAAKSPVPATFLSGVNRFLDRFQKRLAAAARTGWWQRLRRLVTGRRRRDFYKAQFVLHLPVREEFKHRLLAQCVPEGSTGTRLDTSR